MAEVDTTISYVLPAQTKARIQELLEELEILGPAELPEWNIRAQTLLVFEVGRKHCMRGPVDNDQG